MFEERQERIDFDETDNNFIDIKTSCLLSPEN